MYIFVDILHKDEKNAKKKKKGKKKKKTKERKNSTKPTRYMLTRRMPSIIRKIRKTFHVKRETLSTLMVINLNSKTASLLHKRQ